MRDWRREPVGHGHEYATRRWAALLQQIFEVDPLACPTCHGAMCVVACITQASIIDQILAHLRTRVAIAPNTRRILDQP